MLVLQNRNRLIIIGFIKNNMMFYGAGMYLEVGQGPVEELDVVEAAFDPVVQLTSLHLPQLKQNQYRNRNRNSRVSDPDTGGSVIFSPPGSRSHKFVRNCSFSSKILTNIKVKMLNFFSKFRDLNI